MNLTSTDLQPTVRLESRLVPAMVRMTLAGVPVDYEAWQEAAEECRLELDKVAERLDEVVPAKPTPPASWNIDGHAGVLDLLGALGIDVPDTSAKTLKAHAEDPIVASIMEYRKRSTSPERREELAALIERTAPEPPEPEPEKWNYRSPSQVLEIASLIGYELKNTSELELLRHRGAHPFFDLMLEYRHLAKLVDNYGVGWFKDAYHDGRVYPSWWQLGTSTGRMACSTPNLQQLPQDGPYRSCVKAPAGRTFVIADYGQIELRIAAKIAPDDSMLDAFERGLDVHQQTAEIITGKKEPSKDERRKAKSVNFGLLYGMRAKTLPEYALKNYGVKMSQGEATRFYNRYFAVRQGLKAWQELVKEEFYASGKSLDRYTMIGRRRSGISVLNEALNHPIQGTGADGLKFALVLLHERRAEMPSAQTIIAAHDEIVVECDHGDAEKVGEWVREIMVEAMSAIVNRNGTRVPIEVESTINERWVKP